MNQQPFIHLKRYAVLALIGIVCVFTLVWVYTHGFVEVSVPNTDGKELTYIFRDETTGKSNEIKTTSTSVKKLLPKSDYKIIVKQADSSAVFLARSPGLLQTQSIERGMEQEKFREYVGNEPNTCMYYGQLLYSYDCGDTVKTLKMHVAATDTEPTYVLQGNDPVNRIRAMLSYNGRPSVVAELPSDELEGNRLPAVKSINSDLTLEEGFNLKGLDTEDEYKYSVTGGQLLAYNDPLDTLFLYSDLRSEPKKIAVAEPKSANLTPLTVSLYDAQIGTFYTEANLDDEIVETSDEVEGEPAPGKSEFILYTDGKPQSFQFGSLYKKGLLCGQDTVCLLGKDKLDIFNLSGSKTKKQLRLSGVKDVQFIHGQLFVFTETEIMALDQALTGSIVYSYGNYTFCGFTETTQGFVACVLTPQHRKSALAINLSSPNRDSIDKKVLEMLESPSISTVSMYKDYMYISPNYGKPTIYDPAIRGFTYDPAVRSSTNAAIEALIDTVDIDRALYKIIR